MAELKSVNMPVLTVDKTVNILTEAYVNVIGENLSPKILPSVMLWGPPGVGKSQAIRQIGKGIEAETGKRVEITDVRLLLFNPIDLRGIPVANEERTLAVWLKPKIFQMDPGDDVINILFLDEISAAPQSVQAAAYQITLDRVVGEHKLPDNCIVIAAGNRVTDKSVSFKMPKALANRLMHLEIQGNFSSWRRWAVKEGINAKVLGFLSFRNDRLFGFDPKNDDLAFATPRSWEMVSSILNHVSDNPNTVYSMIAGLVGSGVALEFKSWCRIYADLPTMQDIFTGRDTRIPSSTDGMYAVVSSMTQYAKEHMYELEQIGWSLEYAKRLPADFASLLIQNYMDFDKDYGDVLRKIPEYQHFISAKGVMRNGYVN